MGIFGKPKLSNEERINRKIQEEIERHEDRLNTCREIYNRVQPIIKKYGSAFGYISMFHELELHFKEDVKEIDPEIFCDAGKLGLVAVRESGYNTGYIKITLL